jgi:nickel transport protein
MKKTALLITALFGASLANAHNVWLEPVKDVKGQYVVKFGHEETETYPQSKLKAVRLLDSKGQLQNATVNFKEGEALFAAPDAAIAFIRFDNGVWSKLVIFAFIRKSI